MTTPVGETTTTSSVLECVRRLEAAIGGVFASLRTMAAAVEEAWRWRARPFPIGDLGAFQPRIFEQLDAQPAFDSAGYVMCEHALADARRHLEWWHRGPDRTFRPLILNVDPGTPDCYDYYTMDWFFAALTQGRRFISGPHIDLPCADVCILTFTDPVVGTGRRGDEVLGVAGADVALSRFESLILPPLRRVGAPAVLVNSERRVITSNDAAWVSGEKLPAMPAPGDEWQFVRPVTADLGWTLSIQR